MKNSAFLPTRLLLPSCLLVGIGLSSCAQLGIPAISELKVPVYNTNNQLLTNAPVKDVALLSENAQGKLEPVGLGKIDNFGQLSMAFSAPKSNYQPITSLIRGITTQVPKQCGAGLQNWSDTSARFVTGNFYIASINTPKITALYPFTSNPPTSATSTSVNLVQMIYVDRNTSLRGKEICKGRYEDGQDFLLATGEYNIKLRKGWNVLSGTRTINGNTDPNKLSTDFYTLVTDQPIRSLKVIQLLR